MITKEDLITILDSKMEPIINDISAIRTDLHAMITHIESINNRLYKLESRVASIDAKN